MTKRMTDTAIVKEFIEVVKRFCHAIDNRKNYSKVELLQIVYTLLPVMCSKGMMLPDIEISDFFDKRMAPGKWKRIFESLHEMFKEQDCYLEQFDPYDFNEEEKEPVAAHLSDDLSDIYCDLNPGLMAWGKANAKQRRDIVYTWRLIYEIHWGDHAIGAFRAIHCLLYDYIDGKDGYQIGVRYNKNIVH